MPPKPSQRSSDATLNEHHVEKILNKRRKKGGVIEYRIKWESYDSSWNTWEPAANLSCPEKVAAFEQERKGLLKKRKTPVARPVIRRTPATISTGTRSRPSGVVTKKAPSANPTAAAGAAMIVRSKKVVQQLQPLPRSAMQPQVDSADEPMEEVQQRQPLQPPQPAESGEAMEMEEENGEYEEEKAMPLFRHVTSPSVKVEEESDGEDSVFGRCHLQEAVPKHEIPEEVEGREEKIDPKPNGALQQLQQAVSPAQSQQSPAMAAELQQAQPSLKPAGGPPPRPESSVVIAAAAAPFRRDPRLSPRPAIVKKTNKATSREKCKLLVASHGKRAEGEQGVSAISPEMMADYRNPLEWTPREVQSFLDRFDLGREMKDHVRVKGYDGATFFSLTLGKIFADFPRIVPDLDCNTITIAHHTYCNTLVRRVQHILKDNSFVWADRPGSSRSIASAQRSSGTSQKTSEVDGARKKVCRWVFEGVCKKK